MAGSKNYFKYTADDGVAYSVILDESNSKATVGGEQCMPFRTAAHPFMPKGIRMRYVNARLDSNPRIKRRFWLGSQAAVLQALSGSPLSAPLSPDPADGSVPGVAWTVESYRGEQSRVVPKLDPVLGDTGLIDGTPARDA